MQLLPTVLVAIAFVTQLATAVAVNDNSPGPGDTKEVFKVGEHTITSSTQPIDEARIEHLRNDFKTSPITISTLSKRAEVNVCSTPTLGAACENFALTAPLLGDCHNLGVLLVQTTDQLSMGSPFPCNIPRNVNCPNFAVPPGSQRTFTLGTCAIGFANLNDVGGDSISYCDFILGFFIDPLANYCITGQNSTGGFAIPPSGPSFALFLTHA